LYRPKWNANRYIFSPGRELVEVWTLPLPLVDRSSQQIEQRIRRKVEAIKDVRGIRHVTVRLSAKRLDVDVHVFLDSDISSEDAHRIAFTIEKEVRNQYPNARISVDTEPVKSERESIWKAVKDAAEGAPGSRGAHNIHIQTVDGKLYVDLHLEVSANMTVKQAHDVADEVEKRIKTINADVSGVTVHIESASERISKELTGVESELVAYIEDIAKRFPEIKSVGDIRIRRFGDIIHVVLSCRFDSKLTIKEAHEISNKLESNIKKAYPSIARIDVHEEPEQA
jgi:divalent metal cation (Fe/Co/Zn/Cd) transporter